MDKFKKILSLFVTMLKIGLFTFGGGYAMIAILEREFVEKKKWLTNDEFLDIIGIAESTPGPIAINSSTYIGYKQAGGLGSVFSTLGVVIPSFVVILIISLFFDKFLSLEYVNYAFRGIQACVAFLILNAGIKMLTKLKINFLNVFFCSVTFICMIVFTLLSVSFSSIFYILIGGGISLFVYSVTYFCKKKKNKTAQADGVFQEKVEKVDFDEKEEK